MAVYLSYTEGEREKGLRWGMGGGDGRRWRTGKRMQVCEIYTND